MAFQENSPRASFFVVKYTYSFGVGCKSQSVVIAHESKRHDLVEFQSRPYSRDERKNMFTGIITHLGKISKKTDQLLKIQTGQSFLLKIDKGTSVCVNGICLTVVENKKNYFSVDFMPETENRTNIKYLQISDLVNLELPATPTSFLSGHIVKGHIDGASKLLEIKIQGNSRILKFSTSPALSKYIVPKGSIAINGISLTVINAKKDHFTVGIIPHTWNNTMFKFIKTGDFVNIEVDILAKYLERLGGK